jgi:AcrR family transcriptional regulator
MTTVEPAGWEGRRPGRPREPRADRAIINATLELFADEGYYSLSMEAVAVKAGVSKATIYRRWAGKRELVIDALATLNDDFPRETDPLPPGGTRDRLLMGLEHMSNRDADSLAGRIMPRMMVYSVSQPDLYAEYFDRVIIPRREWLHSVLRDGVERGELRPDLDIELAAMALIGPVILQVHSMGRRQAYPDLPDHLLDLLWPGLVGVGAANSQIPKSESARSGHEHEPTRSDVDRIPAQGIAQDIAAH